MLVLCLRACRCSSASTASGNVVNPALAAFEAASWLVTVSSYFFALEVGKTLAISFTKRLLSRARVARADITNQAAVTLNRTRPHT